MRARERLARLEAARSPGEIFCYFQDIDNPNLFRDAPGESGETLTREEIQAKHADRNDVIVLWVEHRREKP